jgi:hypothetical protein
MKLYDFAKAKQIIEEKEHDLDSASLGIDEDWFWTAETIYDNGKFVMNLDEIQCIAGIDGSLWGTPVLKLSLKDDSTMVVNCFK